MRPATRALIGLFVGIAILASGCSGDATVTTPLQSDTGTATPTAVDPTSAQPAPTGSASPTPANTVKPGSTPTSTQQSDANAPTPTPTTKPSSSGGSSSPVNPTSTPIANPDPSATPSPVPTPTPVFVPIPPEPDIAPPPDRDLQDLGQRLVEGYAEPMTILPSEPFKVGQPVDFWVSRNNGSVLVQGEVVHVSEHVYWVFENNFLPTQAVIQEVAENFESDVWPAVTEVFGTPLTPGIDGDDRIVVYTAVLRAGVAGYFSSADSFPREILPYSNQREALYMSADRVELTGNEYLSVIAHELQHASHFASDPSEDSWVNEGLSEVAATIAGFARSAVSAFVKAPSTSLTAWAQDIMFSTANYGAANLFFDFLASHYGGVDMLAAVAQNQKDGIASIDSALAEQGFEVTAADVYADWLVANYLSTNEGPYGYADQTVPPVKNIYKRAPDTVHGEVKSFGADYWVTSSGSGRMNVEFQGDPATSLLTVAPYSGETCWWTNHGDSIDSTLTRSVDLRSVESANLSYWTFYDIENEWDYAYVMVSTDGGATWKILDTYLSSSNDPNGNAYGPGLTGRSVYWIRDSVDLSEYAGQEVLLRFEYITDDAVFSKGACFDDFAIPEIDWFDDTSDPGDWTVEGFALVEESLPTQYLLQVIHEKNAGEPVVYQVPVDAFGKGNLEVEKVGDDDLIVVVISAVTHHSTTPTDYTLTISP